ncbi:MAG: TlpA disulfide reductase family protein [Bacteroidales bacterium]|nr:TlpA disulfide reductase family protein [Bacteroidales bacterium]MDY6348170.1 TlpA disulfide reductase family protein [Bacteroidales bacterium]
MRNVLKTISLFFLITLTFNAFCQNPEPDDDAKYATDLLKAGTPAPDFKINTDKGKPLTFSKFAKGHYVVLDFWASWCPDCRKDAPQMVSMYEKFHSKGVKFIGVSFDTDKEKWLAGIESLKLPYTQVCELVSKSQSPTAAAYGVKWIPSVYLIDPEGNVVLSTVLSHKIEKKLEEIFEK